MKRAVVLLAAVVATFIGYRHYTTSNGPAERHLLREHVSGDGLDNLALSSSVDGWISVE
jgi:hypothetical protein